MGMLFTRHQFRRTFAGERKKVGEIVVKWLNVRDFNARYIPAKNSITRHQSDDLATNKS